ncbi:hypothetical protein J7481_18410 [Labrenzia sp. R4_2]|uniref:hypothetical protein n=1 Tax=Labrenzia sp. R4_2 TaxID=2821107 RepID=UPI001ADAB1DA|nr:hypothetical protein [Labrenzia sp. R4_2]MBO9421487.1 hypothetical protein [Labrenzia sp. R4_2]
MSLSEYKNRLLQILRDKEMPVWMTLILMLLGSIITYLLVPYFNTQFEKEKIRTSYIISNMENLNNESISFLNLLKRHNINPRPKKEREVYQKLENSITKLQWKVVELETILEGEINVSNLNDYKDSLIRIADEIRKDEGYDPAYAICEARNFIYASNEIVKQIAIQVDFTVGQSTQQPYKIVDCRDRVAPPVPKTSSSG